MKYLRATCGVVSIAATILAAPFAWAEMSAAETDRLGKDLTPTGAVMAGNKEGTIPAWDGGLNKPPAGWRPEQGYVEPYAIEKPRFTIRSQTMGRCQIKLTPGVSVMIKK